ncbi:MAG: Hpt domain-containing protein [Rhodopila sp.]
MSDSRAEMVEQFVIETQQHIDEIEPILLVAEWEVPDKQAIAALFRCFHSIKGLSRLLELRGLETLAHHAESLLGEVRADRLPFTPAIHDLLLQAFDAIRTLRERSIASGQDTAAPAALVTALQAAVSAIGAMDIKPGAAVQAAQPRQAVLHDDADTLAYFAEMLCECLPNLGVLADLPGDREQAIEDIETLTLAAERLSLKGMQRRLERLAETPAIDRLAELVADAHRVARLTGHATGADALALALAPAPGQRPGCRRPPASTGRAQSAASVGSRGTDGRSAGIAAADPGGCRSRYRPRHRHRPSDAGR